MRIACLLFGILIGSTQIAGAWEVSGDSRSAAIRSSSSDVWIAFEDIPRVEAWFTVSCERDSNGNIVLNPRIDIGVPLSSPLRRRNFKRISGAIFLDSHTASTSDHRFSVSAQSRSIQGSRYGLFTITPTSGDELGFDQLITTLISSLGNKTEVILTSRSKKERDSIRILFETGDSRTQFGHFENLCSQTT